MATIGQLVRVVAEVSGLDESSVKLIARYIREAGYIGQQSTGAGAARMAPRDASALLIAVNSTVLAKDSARAVDLFYNLPMSCNNIQHGNNADVEQISSILYEHDSFGEVLACLIELFMPVARSTTILQYGPSFGPIRTWVEIERPTNEASISIWEFKGENAAGAMSGASSGFYFTAHEKEQDEIDRMVKIRISQKTLFPIATILAV
ncbi:hypothetical protein ACLBXJ_04175 [Methylobacterium mesophilicum]